MREIWRHARVCMLLIGSLVHTISITHGYYTYMATASTAALFINYPKNPTQVPG